MGKKWARVTAMFAVMALLVGMLCTTARAQTLVRVAFYEEPSFMEVDEKGKRTGYGIDYLSALAETSDLRFEYVDCASRQEALVMLDKRKVDVVIPALQMTNIDQRYLLSSRAIASSNGALLAREDDGYLVYEDFASFDNLKVGAVLESPQYRKYLAYEQDNGFRAEIVEYATYSELLEALQMQRVDAAVGCTMMVSQREKVIGQFASNSIYFLAKAGSEDMVKAIDSAITQLRVLQPSLTQDLYDKHCAQQSQIPLSWREVEFVKDCKVLHVACPTNRRPLSYLDENDAFAGILIDLMDEIAAISGLQFEYVAMPYADMNAGQLLEKDIDIVAAVQAQEIAPEDGFTLTQPFFSCRNVLITRNGVEFDGITPIELALANDVTAQTRNTLEQFAPMRLTKMKSERACMDAVYSKDCDAALLNEYVAGLLMSNPSFKGLTLLRNVGVREKLCLAITADIDDDSIEALDGSMLLSVLNKCIRLTDDNTTAHAVINNTAGMYVKISVGDYIHGNRGWILISLALLLVTLAGTGHGMYYGRMRKNMQQQLKAQMNCQMRATKEGVLVLRLGNPPTVIQANEKLRALAGIPDGENVTLEQLFHPDDRAALGRALMGVEQGRAAEFDLNLRAISKDGSITPLSMHGSATHGGDGWIVFCTVTDVAYLNMLEDALSMGREHSRVLVEQTGEMFFDVDVNLGTVLYSPKYRNRFGWAGLSPKFEGSWTPGLICAPDDQAAYDDLFKKIEHGASNVTTRLRIKQKDGKYGWYDLRVNVLFKDQKIVHCMVRVTDVDAQVKELEAGLIMSTRDVQTGLHSPASFRSLVEHEMTNGHNGSDGMLMLMEIDNMALVRNQLTPQRWDELLHDAVVQINGMFRTDDNFALMNDRLVVFVRAMPSDAARQKAITICTLMRKKLDGCHITVSCGIACGLCEVHTFADAYSIASAALERAREKGGAAYEIEIAG